MATQEEQVSQQVEQQPQEQQSVHQSQQIAQNQQTFVPQGYTTVYQTSPLRIVNQQPTTLISSQVIQQAPVTNTTTTQNIKGESRVEYYPIERREVEYKQVEETVTEQVEQDVLEYQEVEKKIIERIPKEVVRTDYQAVEYQKEYVPRIEYETVEEKVPVQKIEYVPVTKVEYVPQEKTEYVTQSRQVERIEYDEIEYQVQRPQVVQQPALQQVVQQPAVVQSVHASQAIQQSQQLQKSVQQPVATTVVQQPLQYSYVSPQPVQYVYQQQPQYTYLPANTTTQVVQQPQVVAPVAQVTQSQRIAKDLTTQPKKEDQPGFIERLFS